MNTYRISILAAIGLLAVLLPIRSDAQKAPTNFTPTSGSFRFPPTFLFQSQDTYSLEIVISNNPSNCQSTGTSADITYDYDPPWVGKWLSFTPSISQWDKLSNGPIYCHVYGWPPGDTASAHIKHFAPCIQLTKEASFPPLDSIVVLHQERIPPPVDSGTRLFRTAVIATNMSDYAVHAFVDPTNVSPNPSVARQDSLFMHADSIFLTSYNVTVSHSQPLKYLDSAYDHSYSKSLLEFTIPPYGTIRLPLLLPSRIAWSSQDVIDSTVFEVAQVKIDSIDTYNAGARCVLKVPAACVAPCDFGEGLFGHKLYSNPNSPAYVGGLPWVTYVQNQGPLFVGSQTKVSCRIVGEYADHFTLSWSDTTLLYLPSYFAGPSWTFAGAPKSVVHDTIITTSTNCYGSVVTRTPIDAYSMRADGYVIRQLPVNLTAPFLGRTQGNAAAVINTSDFPITFRNLRATGYDSMDFEASAPLMIAAHDSGYIVITLKDKNVYLDTLDQSRYATVTGIVAPYQQELGFKDSTFSFSVSGKIDVYCPYYFSLIPKLKHGIHPAGIIFTSSVSSKAGPHTFLTVYGNDDPTTEYFGMPYYDDPHFTLAIGNYTGLGTVTLPDNVRPDTGFPPQNIQVLTTFTGDSHINYQTQLHWPRENDTVTIDVLALGLTAPKFERVSSAQAATSFPVWPNPASDVLRIECGEERTEVLLIDILGRTIRKQTLFAGSDVMNIADVQPEMYQLYIPSRNQSTKVQIIR